MRFPVLDRSDAEGLGRDDPGAVFPRTSPSSRDGSTTAPRSMLVGRPVDCVVLGRRCRTRTVLVPGRRTGERRGAPRCSTACCSGQELGVDEIVTLFGARGPEVAAVAEVADDLRRATVGDVVTCVHNRNINYTNVCTFKCRFCGFSKGPLSLNLRGTPVPAHARRHRRSACAEAVGTSAPPRCACRAASIPTSTATTTSTCARAVKDAAPDIHVHGFTALEVTEGAKRLGEPLDRLPAPPDGRRAAHPAGHRGRDPRRRGPRDPLPRQDQHRGVARGAPHRALGRAALEHHDHVRLGRAARCTGPATSSRTRDLQKETGGFTEFVPLPFVHMAAPIYLQHKARRGPTFREAVLMHAVGRIAYHGHIDNIQASWVKIGARRRAPSCCRRACNDLGGTLMDENISRAAGRIARPGHGRGRLPRPRRAPRPHARAAHHALRPRRARRLTD